MRVRFRNYAPYWAVVDLARDFFYDLRRKHRAAGFGVGGEFRQQAIVESAAVSQPEVFRVGGDGGNNEKIGGFSGNNGGVGGGFGYSHLAGDQPGEVSDFMKSHLALGEVCDTREEEGLSVLEGGLEQGGDVRFLRRWREGGEDGGVLELGHAGDFSGDDAGGGGAIRHCAATGDDVGAKRALLRGERGGIHWVLTAFCQVNHPPPSVFHFLSVVPLLSRGWIVPVGGSTPDRLGPTRLARRSTGSGTLDRLSSGGGVARFPLLSAYFSCVNSQLGLHSAPQASYHISRYGRSVCR